MIRCHNCRTDNLDGSEYCDECGVRLHTAPMEAVVAPQPIPPPAPQPPPPPPPMPRTDPAVERKDQFTTGSDITPAAPEPPTFTRTKETPKPVVPAPPPPPPPAEYAPPPPPSPPAPVQSDRSDRSDNDIRRTNSPAPSTAPRPP